MFRFLTHWWRWNKSARQIRAVANPDILVNPPGSEPTSANEPREVMETLGQRPYNMAYEQMIKAARWLNLNRIPSGYRETHYLAYRWVGDDFHVLVFFSYALPFKETDPPFIYALEYGPLITEPHGLWEFERLTIDQLKLLIHHHREENKPFNYMSLEYAITIGLISDKGIPL